MHADTSKMASMSSFKKLIVITTVCTAVFFIIGILIGRFAILPDLPSWLKKMSRDGDSSISQKLMNEIKAENIKKNLEFFTKKPHIAGSEQEEVVLVEHIVKEWKAQLDGVKIYPYKVLLSYPNASNPNYVAIELENGTEVEQSAKVEKILSPDQDDPTVVNPFNAYSPAGIVKGGLVYVNYGRIEDFMYLKRDLAMNLNGTIAIARYGKIFRGDKAKNAEEFGCKALIIYSDPADYAVGDDVKVYPDDWWLPGTGAQRGTLFVRDGDPLTPYYPSIDSAYFLNESEDLDFPSIPVTPIGYDDAVKYLSKLDGPKVNSTWQGKLNITYRFGPGFSHPYDNSKMKLCVHTYNERRTTNNVIGYIRGAYEPDRYVIIGNHRDAWVFGAVDPSSGTAAMMELSRAMGKLLKDGWRPRRSIIFCSWGAEEYGLLGSTEWGEELAKILSTRTVAYLNVDIAVEGNATIRAKGTPNLHSLLREVTKKVENPNQEEIMNGRKTVYDTWLVNIPSDYDPSVPLVQDLGAGSDFKVFLQCLGTSVTDIRYTYDQNYKISSYPMYHSVYETFDLVSRLMDRDFKYHQAISRVWGELARILADNVILKLDCIQYAEKLQSIQKAVQESYGDLFSKNGITLDNLARAVQQFKEAAIDLHQRVENVDLNNPLEVRSVNDQLMNLERAFIDPLGISGRPWLRHVIFAPSQHDTYASSSFPGLTDALFDIENDPNQEKRWEQVKKELSVITFTIQSAASTMRNVNDIGGL